MIEPIRNGILGVNGAADDIDEDFLNDDKTENEVSTFVPFRKNRMLIVKGIIEVIEVILQLGHQLLTRRQLSGLLCSSYRLTDKLFTEVTPQFLKCALFLCQKNIDISEFEIKHIVLFFFVRRTLTSVSLRLNILCFFSLPDEH